MKQETKFSYKKAIIVDSKMLNEMDKEIRTICEKVSYKAETINGDKIEFESIEELCNYENADYEKIVNIHIFASDEKFVNKVFIYIKCESTALSKLFETVEVNLTVDDVNKKVVFKNNIIHLLKRCTQNKRYNVICKSGIFELFALFYAGLAVVYAVMFFYYKGEINIVLSAIMIFLFILYCLRIPLEKIRDKYYPSIVFYLGDQIKYYEEQKNTRNNFFWTVCISGTLTIVIGIIGLFFTIR